ncbi:DUF4190 domain-containing protein [Streptomyces sp. NPDC006415]|uniref:DUF4190 domain-containing protein n=1 Tax=Streptomyces sp. NPDC006415 TaxID=3155351 RepID=UPI0033A78DF7
MTLTDFARRTTDTPADAGTGAEAAGPAAAAPAPVPAAEKATTDARTDTGAAGTDKAPAGTDAEVSRAVGREADGLAVASFVLGLVGLLVFNILLGPTAIVMALLALARRTRRRGRAHLGLALGVADLAVFAALVTVNGTVSWSIGG